MNVPSRERARTGSGGLSPRSRLHWLWAGESSAQLGTAMMEFALGAWAYRQTGSTVAFANVVLAATLPSVLFLPFAGGLADKVDRKHIIIATDVSIAILLLALVLLSASGLLRPLHLYLFNAIASVISSFRTPAYQASVSTVIDNDMRIRVNGLLAISKTTSSLVAPLIAGATLAASGLTSILAINAATFCLGTLFVLKAFSGMASPQQARHPTSPSTSPSTPPSVLGNVTAAFSYFRREGPMLVLLLYTMVRNALLALATLMMTPLTLSQHDSKTLGLIYAAASLGGITGGSLLVALRNPRRLMLLAIAADLVLSTCVVAVGFATSAALYCLLTFVSIAAACIADGSSNTLWMHKVPASHKASILALIHMTSVATKAVALLGGGLLVDHLLEPAMAANGALAQALGPWLGVGKGRGIALLFIASGCIGLTLSLTVLSYRRTRRIDLTHPDGDAQTSGAVLS
jgi:diaminobutyrate-2-oxoglutarate transaminase